jgi:flavin-dependent dehydrogenase
MFVTISALWFIWSQGFYETGFCKLEKMRLQHGGKIVVLGGGPAGALFAIHLLRQSQQAGIDITVTIIDKKAVRPSSASPCQLRGCNYCAGIISPRLHDALEKSGIALPEQLICEEFSHIWIHGLWKNFPLKLPPGQRMYSLFRGSLPHGRQDKTAGLDDFLLNRAQTRGAAVIAGEVIDIRYAPSKKPYVTVATASKREIGIESDFLAIATGIAPVKDSIPAGNPVFKALRRINPGFTPPEVRPALIFELKPGRAYLKKYMNQEIYFIVSGSKKLSLDHICLVPKGDYLTVALVGDRIDRASFPEDTQKIIDEFLSLSHCRAVLPHITLRNTPVACSCTPFMVTAPAEGGICDRMAVVGDALGSRLYRDGIFSAFVGAEALAKTIIHRGVDQKSLSNGYEDVMQWLKVDSRYAERVIGCIQTVLKSPFLSRILYQTFATEMKHKIREQRPLGQALLDLGSGGTDYAHVYKNLIRIPVLLSILRGAVKTIRNMLTERFFGLSWEDTGRYPTVILKEKRGYFKKTIAKPLGITLDASPEMERMYAIKIRAPARMIFQELGKFGEAGTRFLRLRFLDVTRISGSPNTVGAVVRYRLKRLPIAMDIRLARSIPDRTLLYEPGELFSQNGKLIFDIASTKDGNSRLVIYTAFDFKRGRTAATRLFWKLFKKIFPEYAHDVVWNHAICCIKKDAEKRAA